MQRSCDAGTHGNAATTGPAKSRALRGVGRLHLGLIGATALSLAAFAAPAVAAPGIGLHATINSADPADPFGHFPEWFQDAEGQRLELCLAAACAIPPAELPNPDQPISYPDNFPGEAFWFSASADLPDVGIVIAQEATLDGGQGGFGRVRIVAKTLDSGWFRVTYPYGQFEFEGNGHTNPYSDDTGCFPLPGAPCDDAGFNLLANSAVGPNFLQWDSAVSPAPPAGFTGDGATPHRVVGSTFVAPGETTPANYFRVDRLSGPGGEVTGTLGQTDQFVTLGKLAANANPIGMLVGSDGRYGNQRVGRAQEKLVTLRNGGGARIELDGLVIGGEHPAEFSLGAGCDSGTIALDPGESCTIPVTFTPAGTGARSAHIQATEVTGGTSRTRIVRLAGTGVEPVLSLPGIVSFGNQLVGNTIGPRIVEVQNTGTDAMHVTSALLGGGGAGEYTLGLNTCNGADVAPGASCTVQVFFRPLTNGTHSASLQVISDAGTRSVTIGGAGVSTPDEVTVIGDGGTPAGPAAPNAGAALGAPLAVADAAVAAKPKLSLTSLGGSSKVKRAKATKSGIRLVLRVKDGTEVVRIKVYRRTTSGRKLLSDGYKTIGSGSLQRVTQNHLALKRAFRVLGRYEVEVTPGRSTSDLGTTSKFAFRIVK